MELSFVMRLGVLLADRPAPLQMINPWRYRQRLLLTITAPFRFGADRRWIGHRPQGCLARTHVTKAAPSACFFLHATSHLNNPGTPCWLLTSAPRKFGVHKAIYTWWPVLTTKATHVRLQDHVSEMAERVCLDLIVAPCFSHTQGSIAFYRSARFPSRSTP